MKEMLRYHQQVSNRKEQIISLRDKPCHSFYKIKRKMKLKTTFQRLWMTWIRSRWTIVKRQRLQFIGKNNPRNRSNVSKIDSISLLRSKISKELTLKIRSPQINNRLMMFWNLRMKRKRSSRCDLTKPTKSLMRKSPRWKRNSLKML